VQDFELGKRGGVAGEVHYIAIRPGTDAMGSDRLPIACGIKGFDDFPFELKVFVSRLNLRLNASITQDSNWRATHGQCTAQDGTWV
jgi:hypothetical protein